MLSPVRKLEAATLASPARMEARPAPAPAKIAPAVVLSRATEDSLMDRASSQMTHGDGAGARAVYEVLAHYGSPKGAFSLAETYDPAFLATRPARGLAPDLALAREWYSKAAELGNMAAYARLKELDRQGGSRR
jgi:TPR repeat protein